MAARLIERHLNHRGTSTEQGCARPFPDAKFTHACESIFKATTLLEVAVHCGSDGVVDGDWAKISSWLRRRDRSRPC